MNSNTDEHRKVMTLCLVYQHPNVLLGMKKRGFGAGRWNGFGGKVGPGETVEQAARRELQEEAGIEAVDLELVGRMQFRFSHTTDAPDVYIFKTTEFNGNPMETEEMKPQWYTVDSVPYDSMWPDDQYWMPLFFAGKRFKGSVYFGESDTLIEQNIVAVGDDESLA